MTGKSRTRGQSGLDRLLLFVVLVIVLVVVAPTLLGFAGVDVRPDGTGQAAPAEHDLTILAARGGAVDERSGTVGAVRLVVSPQPGREPVDLSQGTAVWIGEETVDLVPVGTGSGDADGQYGVTGGGGEGPVLQSPTDRGVLQFDLGTDDVAEVPEFGDRLEPGETATVVLVTPAGETISRQVRVPRELPDDADEVGL